jgi:hypothetical protein
VTPPLEEPVLNKARRFPIIKVTEGVMTVAANHKPDARQTGRFSLVLPASYLIYNDWCECELLNVSSGGASVRARQVFLRGDKVRLRIAFEGEEAFIDARVAYSSGMKAGLSFVQHDRDAIEAFLSLVDDVLVHKARVEVKDYFARYRELKLPLRSPFEDRPALPAAISS